ncbi:TPA: hypothetical protein ACY17N_006591 [Pseudomonas aeruginosa]
MNQDQAYLLSQSYCFQMGFQDFRGGEQFDSRRNAEWQRGWRWANAKACLARNNHHAPVRRGINEHRLRAREESMPTLFEFAAMWGILLLTMFLPIRLKRRPIQPQDA